MQHEIQAAIDYVIETRLPLAEAAKFLASLPMTEDERAKVPVDFARAHALAAATTADGIQILTERPEVPAAFASAYALACAPSRNEGKDG